MEDNRTINNRKKQWKVTQWQITIETMNDPINNSYSP